METANVNDDKNSESSSSELTDQASSHISDITNSEKRWEAIEKKVKENEKAYKLKVKQMEKKNPNIMQDSKNNLTVPLGRLPEKDITPGNKRRMSQQLQLMGVSSRRAS